jgi:hypothetical protein
VLANKYLEIKIKWRLFLCNHESIQSGSNRDPMAMLKRCNPINNLP